MGNIYKLNISKILLLFLASLILLSCSNKQSVTSSEHSNNQIDLPSDPNANDNNPPEETNPPEEIKQTAKESYYEIAYKPSVSCEKLTSQERVFYIDHANGDNANPGTKEKPWRHSPGDINATGIPAKFAMLPGDAFLFKGGVYYYGGIQLAVSGAAGNPIYFRGDCYGEGRALLDGSSPIQGPWKKCVSKEECGLNENYSNIYYADLPAGIFNNTPLYEGDSFLWPAQYPKLDDPFWIDNLSKYKTIPKGSLDIVLTKTSLKDPALQSFPDNFWKNAYVAAWVVPNVVVMTKVLGYDKATSTLSINLTNDVYTDRDGKYSIINSLYSLSAPGEYAVDEENKKIYLWPRNSIDASIRFAKLQAGFNTYGKSHIVFEGFTVQKYWGDIKGWYQGAAFSNTSWNKEAASDIVIRGNEIRLLKSMENAGTIWLWNTNEILVENNYLHDCQKNRGITLGGDNTIVKNNILRKVGGTGIYFTGALNSQMIGNTLTEIKGVHANALTAYQGCKNVLIANNKVRTANLTLTLQASSDIYIYNNLLDGMDGVGYLIADWDNMSGKIYVLNNLLVNSNNNASVYVHSADDIIIKNNILEGGGSGTRSHNIWIDLAWSQNDSYGWKLAEGEIIEKNLTKLFIDPLSNNYLTKAGSPAINSGTDVEAYLPKADFKTFNFDLDIEGKPRKKGNIDIGPYEYQ